MKYPTVSAYLEAIKNSNGRFRTLGNIEIIKNKEGDIEYSINSHRIDVSIKFNNKYYLLLCPLSGSIFSDVKFQLISKYIKDKSIDYLLNYTVLPSEIYVFDSKGKGYYADVIMRESQSGATLAKKLYELARKGDVKGLDELFHLFLDFAKSMLLNKKFVHNNLRIINILIIKDNTVSLVDYRRLIIPTMDEWAESENNDNISLLELVLLIYSVTQNPEIYNIEPSNSQFKVSEFLYEIWANNAVAQVAEIFSIIHSRDNNIERIKNAMNSLLELKTRIAIEANPDVLVSSDYEIMDECYEGILSAKRDDGKCGFVRASDREIVVPFIYDWVGGIEEGLSIVKIDSNFGVINKDGYIVLPPEFEDVSWVPDNGVILASKNGKWRFYSRSGEVLSRAVYDKIGDFSHSRAWVEKSGKCGFVDRSCNLVIPLIYDEVTSFDSNGIASVKVGRKSFAIDNDGIEV